MPKEKENLWSSVKRMASELRGYRWNRGSHVSSEEPIIIGGCGRSGTTLMRVILDSHSQICCGPESNLFASQNKLNPGSPSAERLARKFDVPMEKVDGLLRSTTSRAEFIDEFFKVYRAPSGKPLWADKTPRNIQVLDFIFEHFPRARFIHMIRDGRDVVCSLRTHPRFRLVDGQIVKVDTWNPIEECVERWVQDVKSGLRFRGDPRCFELRYEDVVQSPEPTLRALFEFLRLPWEPDVLRFNEVQTSSRDVGRMIQSPEATRPLQTTAVARWRRDLDDADLAYVLRETGPLLRTLGYSTDETPASTSSFEDQRTSQQA